MCHVQEKKSDVYIWYDMVASWACEVTLTLTGYGDLTILSVLRQIIDSDWSAGTFTGTMCCHLVTV